MHTQKTSIAAVTFAGIFSVACLGTVQAADVSLGSTTLKPISEQGAAPDQNFLLNIKIGRKQAVSYFHNDRGVCRLTAIVGDAFNGEHVPDRAAVRFAVGIEPAKTALIDTAEGKALQFTCLNGARAMSVKTLDQVAGFPPAMW